MSAILRTILPQALDADVFAVVSTRISKENLSKCRILDQTRNICEAGNSTDKFDLNSTNVPSTRVVAVVDRTANISEAASIIGASRAVFNGQSDYSPALVLVNEFVADEFLFHLTQSIISPAHGGKAISRSSHQSKDQSELERDNKLKVIIWGENGSIVEVKDR